MVFAQIAHKMSAHTHTRSLFKQSNRQSKLFAFVTRQKYGSAQRTLFTIADLAQLSQNYAFFNNKCRENVILVLCEMRHPKHMYICQGYAYKMCICIPNTSAYVIFGRF